VIRCAAGHIFSTNRRLSLDVRLRGNRTDPSPLKSPSAPEDPEEEVAAIAAEEDEEEEEDLRALRAAVSLAFLTSQAGKGPRHFSKRARCSGSSWVAKNRSPRRSSPMMHPVDHMSEG
jgi:hypothetical protein